MRIAVVASLIFAAAVAHASAADKIVAGARVMAGRKASRDAVVLAAGKRVEVWVRPGARVVGVTQYGRVFGFPRQLGFLLDAHGNLSAPDQARLATLVGEHTKATEASVDHALARGTELLDAHERVLVGQDGAIDGMLARIRAHRGAGDLVLSTDGKRTLTYRPGNNVIVETRGTSQRGYFLQGSGAGLTVAPTSRDGLREALASRRAGR